MTDEIKAAAERLKQGCCQVRYGEGGPWYRDPQYANDAIVVAEAYIAEQAERALPITVEWLKSIGFKCGDWYELSPTFAIDFRDNHVVTLHVESNERFSDYYRLPLSHITTRGQVLDLLRLLGKEVKP